MYVKVYEYHIPTDKTKEYLCIQEKASNIIASISIQQQSIYKMMMIQQNGWK